MVFTPIKGYPNYGTIVVSPPNPFPSTIAAGSSWNSNLIPSAFGGALAGVTSDQAGALTIQRYADLAGAIPVGPLSSQTLSNATVTITIASPAVVSWTGHGLSIGNAVSFFSTGVLPTGILPGVPYYIIASGFGANAFEVSATPGGAAIVTTGSQSGTQTAGAASWTGFADGLPYLSFAVGLSNTSGSTANVANGAILTGPPL